MRYALAIVLLLACSGCARSPEPSGPKPIWTAADGRGYGHWECPTGWVITSELRSSWFSGGGGVKEYAVCVTQASSDQKMEDYERRITPEGKDEWSVEKPTSSQNDDNIHGGGDSTRYKPLTWKDFGSTGPLVQHNDNVPIQNEPSVFSGNNVITNELFMSVEPAASVLINWEGGGLESGASNAYPIYSVEIKDSTGKELVSCGWDAETKHVKDCKLENDASLESAMDALVQAFKGTYEGNRK